MPKRLFDVIFSLFGLVIFSLLLLCLAFLIIKGWLHVEEKHGRLYAYEEKEVFLGEVTV